ncbi:MAG: hypothetical protein U1A25_03190 [Candidatus Sungbacteria bacterium]|nr:hypothetical protein [bacterium]MDZ4260648.1 hypothetical protein [Candidatus Sungbacteria bacterium]
MADTESAKKFLAIDTIREDVIVLKQGGLRVVLMCSSLNFALKSTDEQDAIIFQYQNFLNSLDFPVQFVINSRKLNISPYIDSLRSRQKDEDNELLKIQINEYIDFISSFVETTNIMSKTFYVVVPFTPSVFEKKGFGSGLFNILSFKSAPTESDAGPFEEQKNQLWQRVDSVITGLRRFGIRSAPLNTEELIELFYGLYNPSEFEKTANPGEIKQATL